MCMGFRFRLLQLWRGQVARLRHVVSLSGSVSRNGIRCRHKGTPFACAICRRSRLLSRGLSKLSRPPRPSHLRSPRQDGSTAVRVRRLAGDMPKRRRTSEPHGPTPAAPSGIAAFAAVPTGRNSTLRPWRLYWDVGCRNKCHVRCASSKNRSARIARICRKNNPVVGYFETVLR